MEVKAIVLEGKTYVLIPEEIFNKSVGIKPEMETTPPPTPAPAVHDFSPEPPVIETMRPDSVVIVNTMPNVKKAQGKEYGYGKRLREQNLQPEDVMVLRNTFENMPEIPEIARSDFKSKSSSGLAKAKWGFYGEGVERDLG